MRKALAAVAAAASLLVTDAAMAQDAAAGIWATRPRPRHVVEESVPASTLPGLAPGLRVQTTGGKMIGVVTKVMTGPDGSIRKVYAISPAGNAFKLSPTSLTVDGGVVTTTEERGS